jgi:hypothetical protein
MTGEGRNLTAPIIRTKNYSVNRAMGYARDDARRAFQGRREPVGKTSEYRIDIPVPVDWDSVLQREPRE